MRVVVVVDVVPCALCVHHTSLLRIIPKERARNMSRILNMLIPGTSTSSTPGVPVRVPMPHQETFSVLPFD